jgi:hypothetical protein
MLKQFFHERVDHAVFDRLLDCAACGEPPQPVPNPRFRGYGRGGWSTALPSFRFLSLFPPRENVAKLFPAPCFQIDQQSANKPANTST